GGAGDRLTHLVIREDAVAALEVDPQPVPGRTVGLLDLDVVPRRRLGVGVAVRDAVESIELSVRERGGPLLMAGHREDALLELRAAAPPLVVPRGADDRG